MSTETAPAVGPSGVGRGNPGLLDRLYPRFGVGYLALVVLWLAVLGLAGGMLTAVVATRLLARSFGPPVELVLLVTAAIVIGNGAPFALMWRDAQPLVRWIRAGRPAGAAPGAWDAGVMAIRRAFPRCFALVSALLLPANVWAARHYHLGASGFPVTWLFTQLGIAATAAYMFFVGEAMLRPMIEDAARTLPPHLGVGRARIGIRLKVLLALAVTTAFAVLVSQAIGSIGQTPSSRMVGAVAIAALIALVFTPVLIRVVTDSVVDPVRTLIVATTRAAAGDLECLVPVTSDDELGLLTSSFNDMLRGLRERQGLRQDKVELTSDLHASLETFGVTLRSCKHHGRDWPPPPTSSVSAWSATCTTGAQQQLVLLGLKLGMAQRLIKQDPEAAVRVHDELQRDLSRALSQLRDLAHGIYPAVLESEGLPSALREAAARAAIPAELRCQDARRHAREVEAAVYFCCLEALQNAGKHAGATAQATIRLDVSGQSLVFQVADDGRGFDTAMVGTSVGVQSMTDRIGALGGRLTIESTVGTGTRVLGSIPLRTVRTEAPPAQARRWRGRASNEVLDKP